MHTIYLALGSNVGKKATFLTQAIDKLKKQLQNVTLADFYTTQPMYVEDQEEFLNTVMRAETSLSPESLLTFVKGLEKEIGRKERFRNGPREIDIDILFYNDVIMHTNLLQIPHPRIQERNFVLRPFMDIAPEFMHPVLKKTIKEIYKKLNMREE
ncbi:MAG: 2-amino-4-hydroxy-6-hydroxymethyldihydropteridine diphosphokinase [Patescibacteria group bacterium]